MFIGIATAGRSEVLAHTLEYISRQDILPEAVFICSPENDPALTLTCQERLKIILLQAPKGLCTQRNRIMDELRTKTGFLLMIDDDFLLHPKFCGHLDHLHRVSKSLAMVTGTLISDGIIGPGLRIEDATGLISACHQTDEIQLTSSRSAYGCNMAINLNLCRDLRFDETLPLYGWQEDVDFSTRAKTHGWVVKTNWYSGVHLGVKFGRNSGVKTGYAQIANPLYLMKKRTIQADHALGLMFRNVSMNLVRSIKAESYIDRRGRLKGNLIAVIDAMRGRLHPSRILDV